MDLLAMDHESNTELKDFDTIFVTGHLTSQFFISWSKDDKIALVVDEGVQIFELHPTPLSDQLTITFLRSWIPVSSDLPLRNAIVDNKANSFVWKLKKNEVYDMAIDSTLCTIVEKTSISSFIIQCVFSPLICNESYICCLTNNGVLQIYKWDLRKWKTVINVSNLWIEFCQLRDDGEDIDYNNLKKKMFQMKILTMAWLEKPKPTFVTGHEDGGICIWDVDFVKNSKEMKVDNYFHITGKPSCISFCEEDSQQICLLIIGTIIGTVKYVAFKVTSETGLKKIGNESELWNCEDFIKPIVIKCVNVGNDKYLFIVKNHILIMQKLKIDKNGVVTVLKTAWQEFSAPIVTIDDYEKNLIVGTRNHDFYTLRINENGFKVEKDINLPLKPKHSSCFHCYGLAMSKNKAIWIIVSSVKVNYDSKTMKDTNHLLIFTPKMKTFRSLTDGNYSSLVRKIGETFGTIKMTDISDLLEMKKVELLADPTNFVDENSVDENISLLRLKLLLWESKLRIYTQSAEIQNVVAECEEIIVRRWCSRRRQQYLDAQTKLTDLQRQSLLIMESFLNQKNVSAVVECAICGSIAPLNSTKVSSCPNLHTFPRCSLSLLPCDSVPYAFCRLCDSTVRLEFKMKFSSNGSDFGQTRKERKNEVKRCEVSSFRDVNEIKLKLRIRRSKANARERNRMHGLNKALDRLRSTLPIKTLRSGVGMKHKLSKIETLKIACNYIRLLMNILKSDHDMEVNNFASTLAMGLSHTTANVVISSFHQIHKFYSGSSDLDLGTNLPQNEAVSEDWNKRCGL